MLFVIFQLGADRYAIEAGKVLEVLPLMRTKQLPGAPNGIAGVLDYRGTPLPAVDLCALALGRPAAARLSTRILVVECPGGHRLGLIAEHANETFRREPTDFTDSGVTLRDAPYLGPVTPDARGLVQRIDPESLLTPEVREALFTQLAEVT
jgi:chemotaxis-related protein WspB